MRPVVRHMAFAVAVVVGCGGGATTSSVPSGGSPTGTPAGPTLAPTEASEPTGSVATPSAGGVAGRIVFMRGDGSEESGVAYVVNPDGSGERRLVPEGNAEYPTWSPDGSEIHVFCCGDGIAHFVDPETGELLRTLQPPDPALELYCGGSWSPDGSRISCEGFGVKDSSLNGIYTVRTSDGGDPRRITSNPGNHDAPADFSPDGEQLMYTRFVDDEPVGVFVSNLDGSGVVEISPPDLVLDDTGFAGSWSPDGKSILFVARSASDQHKAIWIVEPDGSSPHPFEMTPPCGGRLTDPSTAGCYSPEWSPDGSMIVFTRSTADGENIYIVKADGTGLAQVTNGGFDDYADWGVSPG